MKNFNFINFLIGFVVLVGVFSVFRHFYMQPNMDGGEKAPDFIGLLPDNSAFKLSDLRGQYVLLDFWGSWCGPCIKEFPLLKELNAKYGKAEFSNASGFTIVSVAVEKDREKWLKAIERFGLEWPNHIIDPVSSFRFFDSPIAKLYGVKQLPTKFLINEKGEIFSVDPSIKEVDKFLEEHKM